MRAWPPDIKLGIFLRIAFSLGGLLILALLTLGYVLVNDAADRYRQERLDLAHAQARVLAEGSLDAVVTKDYELLERWVRSVIPADYYAYAFLARPDGRIMTHTDSLHVGGQVSPVENANEPLERKAEYKGRPIQEVIYPAIVGKQHLANAHIAYFLDVTKFHQEGAVIKLVIVLITFLLLFLGAIFWVTRRFTEPLTALTQTVTATSIGAMRTDLSSDLLNRADEVGVLAREYDACIHRLNESYNDLRGEEKRLHDMVEIRTRELVEANRELEAFGYSVSHDLRIPLNTINGYAEVLREQSAASLDEKGQMYLQRISKGAGQMARLIDDIFEFSKLTNKDLDRESVNLSAMSGLVIDRLKEVEPGRDVSVELEENMMALGDAKLLAIVLDNLIGNAWKYTGKKEQAKITISSRSKDGKTIFCVHDNGAGFDMQKADRIFEPFQRLHSLEEYEGTGIGLATVQRIISRHGGRIWAESAVGKGSSFYFTLG